MEEVGFVLLWVEGVGPRLVDSGLRWVAWLVGWVQVEGSLAPLSSVLSPVAVDPGPAPVLPPQRPVDGALPHCGDTGAPHPHTRFSR